MTGVQTCALPICFPVTIEVVAEKTSKPEVSPVTPKVSLAFEPVGGGSLLTKLMKEIKEEEKKEAEQPAATPLTQETLNAFWIDYVANIQQDSSRNLLKMVTLEWEPDHTIKAVTSTGLQESAMKQDKLMIEKLRTHFQRPDLAFQVVLIKMEISDTPIVSNRPPSSREILARFHAVNPAIKEFAERLSLRLEED